MTFDEYVWMLPARVSEVKRLILGRLWEAGEEFPRDWVTSHDLLRVTGQKYFDRRMRELRDQLGCDIETGNINGVACYRLVSPSLKPPKPRRYLSALQKRKLFESHDFKCSVCGHRVEQGTKGLQADHKVPLSRGGDHAESNWQPLCNECNVAKRRACQDCNLDCQRCPWAFPERLGLAITARFDRALFDAIHQEAKRRDSDPSSVIVDAIRRYLGK